MKAFYIIPGLGETGRETGFVKLMKHLKNRSYRAVVIKPNWRTPLVSSFIKQSQRKLAEDLRRFPSNNIGILGFSFGAYIASMLAKQKGLPIGRLFLCSLSPFFADDLRYLPTNIKEKIGQKKIKDFGNHSFPRNIKVPTTIFVGAKEWPLIIKRAEKSYDLLKSKRKLVKIRGARHNFNASLYIRRVLKEIR